MDVRDLRGLVYLASPYTHRDMGVQEQRYREVCRVAGELMRAGVKVFSPIAHSHPIAQVAVLPGHWDFWQAQCIDMIERCDCVLVLMLPGWNASRGIHEEVAFAFKRGMKVWFLDEYGNVVALWKEKGDELCEG